LDAARRSYDASEFAEAAQKYAEAAQSSPLDAESLHRLALARWLTGQVSDYGDLLERSYESFMAAGDKARAATVALEIGRFHAMKLGRTMAEAWMRRAQKLVEGEPDSAATGMIAMLQAMFMLDRGDSETALARTRDAIEIGTRVGDRDVQAMALHFEGRALIRLGKLSEGKSLLDEAMVAAVGGELSTMVTGMIYCSTIDNCADLSDYGRAGEWTEAAKRWCARKSISGFPGICRVHQAEIMRLRGNWHEAEAEARKACHELEAYSVLSVAASGYYEIGEIRLRMGDLDGAEKAFQQAAAMGRDPQPGQATLHLARGKTVAAAGAIRRALEDAPDALARMRLLPAAVQIGLASSPVPLEDIENHVVEIEQIAARYDTVAFRACAQTARGILSLARGQSGAAVSSLRAGVKLWTSEDLPYEAARARLLLAEAYRADGDEDTAVTDAETARATFERLGAILDTDRARAFLSGGAGRLAEAGARESVTFMFTDIVGSTSLIGAVGDDAWTTLLRWHDEALRAAFAEHGGREVKHTGDGFHVVFQSPAAAVACAVAIQRRLDDHRRVQGFAPQVRIGVHATEATRTGADFAGKGVHEAARIAAQAGAGEILASLHTALAGAKEAMLADRRAVSLKGIDEPVEVATIAWRTA
jgi:class 3 adenylate cyclase